MLKLKNIVKTYSTGDSNQDALKGISVSFRDNEFVSILGQSGSGKTTMLNIIGGLDRYTSGDLIINGVSTEEYGDAEWDIYRNHSVGFVFQSYNLIPHQNVLSNVEMALTLAGVSKKERRERAIEVLKKVGLEDHIHKKPNQMSGGQMQRVAIARALINNPDILLADEPTGALDSETSIQIMELLKEIAKDKLVIMVTHNPELAEQYSTRIVKLLDGRIISDSDPFEEAVTVRASEKQKKISMSFLTALSLSFNNLKTKKGRTLLTAMAGSIGIIGIGLVLAISTGMTEYINSIQKDTMSSYPITINSQAIDSGIYGPQEQQVFNPNEETAVQRTGVYSDFGSLEAGNRLTSVIKENNLRDFKKYLDDPGSNIHNYLSDNGIEYGYDIKFSIYTYDPTGKMINSNDDPHLESDASFDSSGSGSFIDSLISGEASFFSYGSSSTAENFTEIAKGANNELISSDVIQNYNLLYGQWPSQHNQVVLVLDSKNSISFEDMFQLGLITNEQYNDIAKKIKNSEPAEPFVFDYATICQHRYYLLTQGDHYISDGDGTFSLVEKASENWASLQANSLELEISGIIQRKPDAEGAYVAGPVAYTNALKNYIIEKSANSAVVGTQFANAEINVLNGMRFEIPDEQTKIAATKQYLSNLSESEKASIYRMISLLSLKDFIPESPEAEQPAAPSTPESNEPESILDSIISFFEDLFSDIESTISNIKKMFEYLNSFDSGMADISMNDSYFAKMLDEWLSDSPDEGLLVIIYDQYITESSYEKNISDFGYVDFNAPSSISLYSDNFENKDAIAACIEEYNNSVGESSSISYTDYVAMMTSSLTSIINGISYVLVAFVAISLFVSSIMIGIITHISVMERTKEIGILRALGASKGNIAQVFNAETFIIGCCSGLLGIGISLLCLIPINSIIEAKTGIENLDAQLPLSSSLILIIISITITILGGFIPSLKAAKKDPVVALRTE